MTVLLKKNFTFLIKTPPVIFIKRKMEKDGSKELFIAFSLQEWLFLLKFQECFS